MFTISFLLVAWFWALIQSVSSFRDDIYVFPVKYGQKHFNLSKHTYRIDQINFSRRTREIS